MGFFRQNAPKRLTMEQVEEQAKVLRVSLDGMTAEMVRSAFRNVVSTAHPDAGGDASAAAERIKEATLARAILLAWIEQLPDDRCPTCRGSGWVRAGAFAVVRPCPRCER